MVLQKLNNLKKTNFFHKLKTNIKPALGRANTGRIIVRHKGGALRTSKINYNSGRIGFGFMEFVVLKKIYDPNRTAFLALICNGFGICQFIIAPENLKVGSKIYYSNSIFSKEMNTAFGSNCTLDTIPTGALIYNIEKEPGKGGVYARSAGCSAKLMVKKRYFNTNYVGVILPSKKFIYLPGKCVASLGIVSNRLHKFKHLKKAGLNRIFGKRPKVRGVAMNPIDHPHGGGEGKSSKGPKPKNLWGHLAKWKKTVHKKKIKKFNFFISKINKLGVSLKTKKFKSLSY